MRLKLDENVPRDLLPDLARLGHDVHTVKDEGLQGQPDDAIWQVAQSEDRFLVTQDLDFSAITRYLPGTHAGILLLRLGEASRRALNARLLDLLSTHDVESWRGCLVVAPLTKVRVRRPATS